MAVLDRFYCNPFLGVRNVFNLTIVKKWVSITRNPHNHTLQTNPWHHEEETQNTDTPASWNISKASRSLFPSKMIVILERTLSTACITNKDEHKTPTHSNTNNKQWISNNRTTALEQTAAQATGGLNAFFWCQIFALDFAVIKTPYFAPKEAS